jgi:hypothetical protein
MYDAAIHPEDVLEFHVKDYFDLSQVKTSSRLGRLDVRIQQADAPSPKKDIPNAKVYDQYNPYFVKNITDSSTLTFLKYLDETSYVLFYDDNQLIYHQMRPDMGAIAQEWSYTFTIFGNDVTCQDAAFFKNRTKIMLGCYTKGKVKGNHTLWLALIDRANGTNVVTTKFTFDPKKVENPFTNTAQLLDLTLEDGSGNIDDYILIYNQGRSHSFRGSSGGFWLYKFEGSEIVPAEKNEIVPFQIVGDTYAFSQVYDIFEYHNRLIVTGKVLKDGVLEQNIKMVSCGYEATSHNHTSVCSDKIIDTGIKDGFVAMVEVSNYLAMYDLANNALTTYQFLGQFGQENWIMPLHTHDVEDVSKIIDLNNNWVKRIEGTANNIAITWAALNTPTNSSANGDVVATTLVSWSMDSSWTMPYAAAVFNNWLITGSIVGVTPGVKYSEVAVTKLDSAWIQVMGKDITNRTNNVITITVSDSESTVSISGTIYRLDTTNAPIVLDYTPPYFDAYSNSVFMHPFDNDNWISGNALSFDVQYNDSHFTNTHVWTTNNLTINFNPPARATSFANLLLAEGVAIVQYLGNNVSFYACEGTHGSPGLFCDYKYFLRLNETDVLQDQIFSQNGMTGIWSTNAMEGHTDIFIAGMSEGAFQNRLETFANSVAFTTDKDNNMYIATTLITNQTVEIFKVQAGIVNNWQHIATVTADNVGYDMLCPYELRFDPVESTTLHIMSACNLLDPHGVNRLISYSIPGFSSRLNGNSITIDFSHITKVPGYFAPSFCPMNDHHIIFVEGAHEVSGKNVIYSIDKTQSTARYNYHLSDYGLEKAKTFECFSNKNMFAILGLNVNDQYNHAVFWGNKKFGNQKIVNSLISDLEPSLWGNLKSFALEHSIVHFGYGNDKVPRYAMTLDRPPYITTRIEHMPGYYNAETPVGYNITAKFRNFKQVVSGVMYARNPNQSIAYHNRRKWSDTVGWVDLESFTRIDGPVKSVSMGPNERGERLQFQSRTRNRGGLDGSEYLLEFDRFRGSWESGVGLNIQGKHSIFVFVNGATLNGTIGRFGARAFDYADISNNNGNDPRTLLLTSGKVGTSNIVEALITDHFTVKFETNLKLGIHASKIRVAALSAGRFIGFLHDRWGTERLTVVDIKFNPLATKSDVLAINVVHTFEGVVDFDICKRRNSGTVHLYFTKQKCTMVHPYDWNFQNTVWVGTEIKPILPDSKGYWLSDIAVNAIQDHNHLAISTKGTVILHHSVYIDTLNRELKTEEGQFRLVRFTRLDKFLDYDGGELFVTDQIVVQKAYMTTPGLGHQGAILAWKRFDTDGTLHAFIELPASETGHNRHPISIYSDDIHGQGIAWGTGDPQVPMKFTSIQNIQVQIPGDYKDKDLDFSSFNILVTGEGWETTVSVQDLMTGNTPTPPGPRPPTPGPARKSWPFFAVLGFLVLAATMWFCCASKSEEEEEEAEYFSMQPESKVTDANAFETGLDDGMGTAGDTGMETAKPTEPEEEDLGLN